MKLGVNKSVNLEMKLSGSRANRWKTIKDQYTELSPIKSNEQGRINFNCKTGEVTTIPTK